MSGQMEHRHGLEGPLAAPGGSALRVRRETASQTAGPYVHIGLAPHAGLLEQVAQMRAAIIRADERAVVDDHGERSLELARYGHGEVVAAARDKGDVDAAASRFGDGGAVGFRHLPTAVEKGPVDVQRDEANGHGSIVMGGEGLQVEKFVKCK